jgi:hypothetical protein
MDEKLRNELKELAQILDAASTKIWQTLQNLPSTSSSQSTVNELNFSALKFKPQQSAQLGDYEIAHKQSNLEDKWRTAFTILRNSNATIKDRYDDQDYLYSYWLYGEDKIYRQKLKPKTVT